MTGVSSVDPTVELANIKARLDLLTDGITYEGIPQGHELPTDAWGKRLPYRDLEPGSTIPTAGQRLLAAGEQGQPHSWSFQVHHFAPTRSEVFALSVATDKSLIGWFPSDAAGKISTLYFTMYDDMNESGERLGYIASRFYEVRLGQDPDMSLQ